MINRTDGFVQKMNRYSTLRRLQTESVTHRYRVALLQHRIRPMLGSLGDLNSYRMFVSTLTGVNPRQLQGHEEIAQLLEELMCLARTLKVILDQSNSSTQLLRSAIALLSPIGIQQTTWEDTDDMAVAIETAFRSSSHLLTRLETAVTLIDRSVRMNTALN